MRSHPCNPGDLRQGRAGQERFPGVNEAAIVAALEGVPLILDEHELSSGVRGLPGNVPAVRLNSGDLHSVTFQLRGREFRRNTSSQKLRVLHRTYSRHIFFINIPLTEYRWKVGEAGQKLERQGAAPLLLLSSKISIPI